MMPLQLFTIVGVATQAPRLPKIVTIYQTSKTGNCLYTSTKDFAHTSEEEGVRLVIDYAFYELGLHQVKANIQPENRASINLAERLGFTKEGFSGRYLKINREWRDHEGWALTV